MTTVAAVAVALTAAGAGVLAGVTAASPSPNLAPVLGDAGQGGAVIVWLKNDHANLNLRKSAASRTTAAHNDQKPVVAAIKASGGTGIVQLVSVNAVAAHVSAAGVDALRVLPAVKEIIPDATVPIGDPAPTGPKVTGVKITPDRSALTRAKQKGLQADNSNPFPTASCGTIDNPLIEPEALQTINAPAMTNAGLATEPGHGVIVANDGISTAPNFSLVGNPNFVRPAADGGGSVVVGATPGDTTDATDGEYYGDASSIAAQGGVLYQYSKELPYSGMPDTCYFKLVGDAPGSSLVDTENIDTPESAAGDRSVMSESQLLAGIDAAVTKLHADVINESYGYSNSPGSYAIHYAANDAAVDAGVTVVASSGDSGVQGTVSSPASDPKIIAAGATNTHRLNAMAYGFAGWVNDDITPLSSGGTTPDNKVVDLVAPGYGGEAACNPHGSDCPANTQTEAFGGTSQSSPLIAGAAADVIQTYRDSHNGDSPSPALVKQLLTSTARDVSAPADQQGAGQVNIKAAIAAAQQMPNTTLTGSAPSLIATPTQLDLSSNGGSTSFQSVSLFNTSNASTTVTGTYRELGPEHQIGSTVTENVSAPDPALPVPADGAQAAPDITFDVPAGLDRLHAKLIWPDPKNGTILSFILTDPSGRLRQISYDYGTASATAIGTVPNIGHVEVANPEAGTWRVQIKWANGRAHLQSLPNVPGTYTGTVSFMATGQNWISSPASPAITIAAHRSATIPLQVAFPNAPGDHPESVQFAAANGATTSLPIARRTLVPSTGGEFDTQITETVGRGIGQITTYNVNVPAGRSDLGVTVTTPDASADNPMSLFLVNPAGTSVATHVVNGRARNGVLLVPWADGQTVTFHVPNPMAGTWEIDVELNLTSSGKAFTQTVVGDLLPQAPAITSPANGASPQSTTPAISGTGVPGDKVTVSNGGTVVCTATVGSDGTWSCTPSLALPSGPATLTATQADQTGNPSTASAPVAITVPTGSTSSTGTVAGNAPATLALTLGGPASFGAFTAGIEKTYTASTTANVISTAADATLSVSDPGHLSNGSFSLPDPLQVSLSKTSWPAPVSNDPVTLGFTQHIGANDALRSGSYSQTLTFTLSTTQP